VRADVHAALAGVDLILHAGDVGGEEVIAELELIGPVRAVFGNTDPRDTPGLVEQINDTFDGVRIHVSHGHELGAPRVDALLAAYDADVIVYGHTHTALVHRGGGRLVVNPGAAGAGRAEPYPSVARLTIDRGTFEVEVVALHG
jgi:putative phosphoesterase